MTVEDRLALLESRLAALDAAEPRAAPLGYFQVAPGESILSDHMNSAILQGVPYFASAGVRDAALVSPTNGTHSHLLDLKQTQLRTAGKWAPVAGVMPSSSSTHAASLLMGTGWLSLGLSADAGAAGGGGWPTPTVTGFTLPASSAPTKIAYWCSFAVVQASVKVTIGFGNAAGDRVTGPTVPATVGGGVIYMAGVHVAQPGLTYTPWINAGTACDVTYTTVRIDALGPA